MAFKSDRSFLDKVSMGATGAIQAKRLLTNQGHDVIELERYSTSNKIWSTKVKRLRVPDLLCLRCGRRMEVRSKSDLKITMSHSPTVRDRQWDYGLRDEDLVHLIACKKETENSLWVASDVINAYTIGDLRDTENSAKLGPAKSASEGAERDLTWPSYVPSADVQVIEVTDEFITFAKAGGRRQTYNLTRNNLNGHVEWGEVLDGGTTIVASVIPQKAGLACEATGYYDFAADLESDDRATLYCAVKALGRIPEAGHRVAQRLLYIAQGGCEDVLVRLEAYASLARLGMAEGWAGLEGSLHSDSVEVRMETVLILDELSLPRATALLSGVAHGHDNDSELRAAAVWGIGHAESENPVERLLPFLADEDMSVAVHAIVACTPHLNSESVNFLLRQIGDDRLSAAIVRVLGDGGTLAAQAAVDYLLGGATDQQKPWVLYLLGLLGEELCAPLLAQHGSVGQSLAQPLSLMWNQHNRNWTNAFGAQDMLDYTLRQQIRGV